MNKDMKVLETKGQQMIKFLIMDVDGTLTDGKIYMGNEGELCKAFNIKDGCGIKDILPMYGIVPVLITARQSNALANRCKELGIENLYQGVRNKIEKLQEIIDNYNIQNDTSYTMKDCAYIGDDILDLQCMVPIRDAGGIVGCPADAVLKVKSVAHYISGKDGGDGAVRDFIEYLIENTEINERIDEKITEVLSYMETIDLQELPVGKYVVDDDVYYMVQEYETKSIDQCRIESHKKYVDIQWIINGAERIDVSDIYALALEEEYDDVKDVMFWKETSQLSQMVLRDGSYAIFYPQNAHRPSIAINKSAMVKKVVIKIKIA